MVLPWPVRVRANSAVTIPMAANMADEMSANGNIGNARPDSCPSGTSIMPAAAWMLRSWPAKLAPEPPEPPGTFCPKDEIDTNTSDGLRARKAAAPILSRSITPARKPSSTTSAVSTRPRNCSSPDALLRSSATERLLRLNAANSPAKRRDGSPPSGRSTRITSAPRSASSIVAYGPGYCSARLSTRTPASGREAIGCLLSL